MQTIKCVKTDPEARLPSRAHDSDVGLDLTAIRVHKRVRNGVILYDTGIAVSPPAGYYLEILPRSSISKTGWMLANSVGTIDPGYTGNLYIALIKVDDDAQELDLPFCKFQLVTRKAYRPKVEERETLQETERGSGGFGSTGTRVD